MTTLLRTEARTTRETRVVPTLLGGEPDDVALWHDGRRTTYAELSALATERAAALGSRRRLVFLEARNDLDTVVTLLAAWSARHPVVLLGADDAARHGEIAATYQDVPAEALHPDLALLLSTSGSTGSPKLARLSRSNVLANARSIADYLGLGPHDRAITSLPLHYCYGLSVLTSHLVAGAGVVLTDRSVADSCFWDLAADTRATGFAGVPHTFGLLDSSGFADRHLPDLRYVTQAGGRLAPEVVRRYARLGAARGFDLVVMYGATEATARMAYLPPSLAPSRPEAIGVPVPGGSFRLEPVEGLDLGNDVGELVYTGPNVMMGYAHGPDDLARGHELAELRTGDLARRAPDGLWEIRGRIDRHAKVFGLRLDLGRLEEASPVPTTVVTNGDRLHAFVDRPRHAAAVQRALVAASGLPAGAVAVHRLEELPTTARGKPDLEALRRQAAAVDEQRSAAAADPTGPVTATMVRDLYAVLLGRPSATTADSFVDLRGDSLSFVEASTRLGRLLGDLPTGWQHLTPVELAGEARARRRRLMTPVEIPTLLRAVAITLIVLCHTDLLFVMGGAHALLGVAGYNLARFCLDSDVGTRRARRVLLALATVALPASAWILVVGGLTGDYRPEAALYLNQLLGSDTWDGGWQFWFLEVLVWGYLGVAALLVVPGLSRWQREHRFGAAMAAVCVTLTLRYVSVGRTTEGLQEYTIGAALFCLALGWAAAEARTELQKLLVVVVTAVAVWGFFADTQREVVVVLGIGLLVVARPVLLPRPVVAVVAVLAHASFWIYLTHWQVYWPIEESGHRVVAALASLAVGVGAACVYSRSRAVLRGVLGGGGTTPAPGGSRPG